MPNHQFEFATASRIVFGAGKVQQVGALTAGLGRRALVVVGGSADRATPLLDRLAEAGVSARVYTVTTEPTVAMAREGVQAARDQAADVIVGFGGGAAIDTGKAISALLTNPGDPLDYLEIIGAGKPLVNPAAPYIAIPTTAGTGAEVTMNAVLAASEQRLKVSLRHPSMLPRIALVDPTLTYTLPPAITASTGMDALTQVIEPFVSNKANPLTDALCREGIKRAGRSLRRAYQHPDDPIAREDMALASLFGGLALANAKLGAVHGFASPIGGMFPAPHGAVCAVLLPHVMEANIRALEMREGASSTLRRYDEIAQILTGDQTARALDGARWVQALTADLNIPPLSTYGITRDDLPIIAEKAASASSMQGNPIKLTHDELIAILSAAL
ncbi:MAG: iron-containing alcohol dehydrogenase [Candidatus Flexifilum sp.]